MHMHIWQEDGMRKTRRLATRILTVALAAHLASGSLGAARHQAGGCARVVGDQWVHQVIPGETWLTIAARVGVDPHVLAARNGLSLRVPLRPGDVLGIDNRHIAPGAITDGIVINVPQRLLVHYVMGAVRAAYPVAVGQPGWPTPAGAFSIIEMETNPTWDVPLSIQNEMRRAGKPVVTRVPPGPANPLGQYWMRLSFGSIGLHGTSAPSSIYHFATHGCIRLHPQDAEDLFHHVRLGEPGEIVHEPVLVAFDGASAFLEVHGDPYRRGGEPLTTAIDLLDRLLLTERVDVREVAGVVRQAEGLAIPLTLRP
jgi:L,D-transpeptidase ErfK/SrfK